MTPIAQPDTLTFLGAPVRVLATGGSLGLVHHEVPAGDPAQIG